MNYTFTEEQVNQILAVLGEVPAKLSHGVINLIQQVVQKAKAVNFEPEKTVDTE